MENINDQVEVVENTASETKEQKKPANVLLGSISYNNESDYEKFLENIDINQALYIIVSGCTFAQNKGAYSLAEAELISKAIKAIKSKSAKPSNESATPAE